MFGSKLLMAGGVATAHDLYFGSDDDTVRRVDQDGNEIWSYDAVSKIETVAPFPDGRVVFGGSDNRLGLLDSDGSEIWYDTSFPYRVVSVAVDPASGAIYAAADIDDVVLKVNSANGAILWTYTGITINSSGVTVGGDGHVYACGVDDTVHKITSAGANVWTFTGDAATDNFKALAVDASGNVVVGGTNGYVYKVNSSGTKVWRVSSIGGGQIYGDAICLDTDGNIYVGTYGFTAKLDSSGTSLWTYTALSTTENLCVRPDGLGNIVIGDGKGRIHKVDSDGNFIWAFTGFGTSDVNGAGHVETLRVAGFSI